MKIYTDKHYHNLLNQIDFNSEDIKRDISNYKLQFIPIKNDNIEWKMKFPMFVIAFYDFILIFKRIPTQRDFFEYYTNTNAQFFKNLNLDTSLMLALKARAFRTYPSLIRDLYFNKYVSERLGENNVKYNLDLDIKEGIDLLIYANNEYWGISLFTKTDRAYQGRIAKINRHTSFDNINYIEMPVDFKGSLKIGDFYLYSEFELANLINLIK